MKTRPMCFVCLFFLMVQFIRLIVVSGDALGDIPASSIFYEQKEKTVQLHGQVYKKTNTSKYQILYLKNNSVNDSHIMVYDNNFINVSIGQTISISGTTEHFERARNPGNYDQQSYYAKQRIYGIVWCEKILKVTGKPNVLLETLSQCKLRWKELIYQTIGTENGSVLAAMLLGEKGDMEGEIKELYQKNGIGHVLAISGLHISFLGLGIYKLVRKLGIGYVPSGVVAICLLYLYGMMIGFSVSVIRAVVMLLIRMGADMCGRVYDMLTALLVAATITIFIQPLYFLDAGFLLSYGAVLGILFVMPMLKQISIWFASLAIHIMLFPIVLYFYFEIPTYSFVLNIIIVPFMSVVLGVGMLGSLGGFIFTPIAQISFGVCNSILELFEWLSRMACKLPFSTMVFGQPRIWEMVLYYILLMLLSVLVTYRKSLKYIGVGFTLFCCIAVLLFVPRKETGMLNVAMLDVGQGDSIFVEGPKGNTYLIDGGSSDVSKVGKYRIEPYLKSQGVGSLDYVFVTHGDSDHYNGIQEMIERQGMGIRIKHLVLPVNWQNESTLVALAKKAKEQGVSLLVMKGGDAIMEGEMRMLCVQPYSCDDALSGNAGSMVLSVCYKGFSMLCTGDVEGHGEELLRKRLQDKTFHVLKVAHHGSKNSSKEQLLDIIRPRYALVSAGTNNSYGHPHKETVERLKKIGSRIYETTKNGAITMRTNGNSLTFQCFIY